MRTDLVINDEEFINLSKNIEQLGERLDNKIDNILNVIYYVTCYGITDGNVNENLIRLAEQIEKLRSQVDMYADNVSQDNIKYISKVDEDDRSIYMGGEDE